MSTGYDVFDIPSSFLKSAGLEVFSDYDELLGAFNSWLDTECPPVDLPFAYNTTTASRALYLLDREAYELTFEEWRQDFAPLADGGYLHESCRMQAFAEWESHAAAHSVSASAYSQ